MNKSTVVFLKKLEILSSVACRLTKLTGKSAVIIHPKHLIKEKKTIYNLYLNKKMVVLDLGCLRGEHTFKIAHLVKKVISVDHDAESLKLADHEKKQRKIKNIEFKVVDIEKQLPFKDQSFDAVLFLDVLEHLHKRDQALLEVKRILKKNGVLILAVPNRETTWKRTQKKAGLFYYSDPDHKVEFSFKEVKKIAQKYKFEIVNLFGVSYDWPYSPVIDLIGGISLSWYKALTIWKKQMAEKFPDDCAGIVLVARNL